MAVSLRPGAAAIVGGGEGIPHSQGAEFGAVPLLLD